MLNHVIISLFSKWNEHLTSFLSTKYWYLKTDLSSQPSSYLTPWSGVPEADGRSASYKFLIPSYKFFGFRKVFTVVAIYPGANLGLGRLGSCLGRYI